MLLTRLTRATAIVAFWGSLLCLLVGLGHGMLSEWHGHFPDRWEGTLCPLMPMSATDRVPLASLTVVALVAVGIVLVGEQAWRTYRRTTGFLTQHQIPTPLSLRPLLAAMGLLPGIVVVDTKVPLAFCFGFWSPRICLSTGLVSLLSPRELRAVLRHEAYHRRRRDPLRLLLIEAVSRIGVVLPIAREWGRLAVVDMELAADREAVAYEGVSALAGALYRLLTVSASGTLPGVVTAGVSATAVRIASLLGDSLPPKHVSLRSVVTSALILCVLCLAVMV